MLKKVDLMSMRHSLEVRVPFLDKEVVKFANSLPSSYKLKNGVTKAVLRDAFRDILPADVFDRPKKGFEVPLRAWIVRAWDAITVSSWFEEDFLRDQGVFHVEGVQQLVQRFQSNENAEDTTLMWAYLVFQSWFQKHKTTCND
jgi:asparagine synthase (glutamine-hydrolysing)